MKTHRALVLGLALTAAVAAHAQDLASLSKAETSHSRENPRTIFDLKKAETNYLVSLNSDVPAVVESALGHVTLMRIAYPKQDLRKVQGKLFDLASRGATQSIRHKAFTAMQVFADPYAFKGAIVVGQTNGDGLLEKLAAHF